MWLQCGAGSSFSSPWSPALGMPRPHLERLQIAGKKNVYLTSSLVVHLLDQVVSAFGLCSREAACRSCPLFRSMDTASAIFNVDPARTLQKRLQLGLTMEHYGLPSYQ